MSFLGIFFNSAKKKGKSHLKNLLSVAMADGKLEDSEYQFLLKIAARYQITSNEVDKLKNEIQSKGSFYYERSSTRFEQIYDLVKMMMIDNHINPQELKICKRFSEKMGYHVTIVDELIESIVQNISSGNSMEETKMRVGYLIKE